MVRVNMKIITVEALKKITAIKKVATDYPANWSTFPTAIYRTISKPFAIDSEGNELQTSWTITVELFSNTSLTDINNELMDVFNDIGFFGTSKDANTADLKRIIVEVSAIVDNVTKYVYQK